MNHTTILKDHLKWLEENYSEADEQWLTVLLLRVMLKDQLVLVTVNSLYVNYGHGV